MIASAGYRAGSRPFRATVLLSLLAVLALSWPAQVIQASPASAPRAEARLDRADQPGVLDSPDAANGSRATDAVPWAPPVPGYRIQVKEEGVYQLAYDDLAAAGLPVDELDPTTLQLYNLGSEVAIRVEGEEDHSLDPGDYLLFYGQALSSKYTWFNVYWLTYGHEAGLRMAVRDGTPSGTNVPAWHLDSLHLEENHYYWSILPGDEDLERFLWAYVKPPDKPSRTFTFSLVAPYAGASGTLAVSLYGHTSTAHPHARVYLNGTLIDDSTWEGGNWHLSSASVPAGLLVAGDNTLEVSSPQVDDLIYVDWADLTFANTFAASGDILGFAYDTVGTWSYQVSGFSASDVVVLDVTDPVAVGWIAGASVVPSGAEFSVSFDDTIAGETDYWVAASPSFLKIDGIELDAESSLGSTEKGADYILITHSDFREAVKPLADYRASLGLRVVQVDVQDVYDEFGYGIVGAHPIHDFLDYAYHHWQLPVPKYVLLVGDGHYDPKDYLGYGRTSYMPPYLAPVDPWMGETSADNRYVTVAGDDVFPDMIIGRLPVNSPSEAEIVVNKTLQYDRSPTYGDWLSQVLFVADDADAGGDFAALSDDVIACCLPSGYTAEKVYYAITHGNASAARSAIIDAINAGRLIVNYTGHASVNVWASESLFSTIDIGSLANATKLPIVLTMTCRDGYYIYPHVDSGHSMAESLVRADGRGAVAAWSPSGLGVSSGHDYLDKGFLQAVFGGSAVTVGEATLAGKQNLRDAGIAPDLLDTYHLFGDPALRLTISPTGLRLASLGVALGKGGSLAVRWWTVAEIDNLGFNVYRAESEDGPTARLNAVIIPGAVPPGSSEGAAYEFADATVVPGVRYFFWVEEVDVYGRTRLHGPVGAILAHAYLPIVAR